MIETYNSIEAVKAEFDGLYWTKVDVKYGNPLPVALHRRIFNKDHKEIRRQYREGILPCRFYGKGCGNHKDCYNCYVVMVK